MNLKLLLPYFLLVLTVFLLQSHIEPDLVREGRIQCEIGISGVTTTPSNCNSSGTATLTIVGGTSPYIGGVNGAMGSYTTDIITLTGLSGGTYLYTFTDAEGCVVTGTFTIEGIKGGLHTTVTTTPTDCGESNGSVTITITGGTPPYSGGGVGFFLYQYSSSIWTVANLSAGTYSYEFTDAEGCVVTGTFTIEDNTDFDVTVTTTPADCNSLGSVTLTITGGTAPYYGGVIGTYLYTSPNNVRTLPLGPGTYSYEFTDAEGCFISGTFTIEDNTDLDATVTTTPADCGENLPAESP